MSSFRRLLAVAAVPITLVAVTSCTKDKAADSTVAVASDTSAVASDTTAVADATGTVAPEAVQAPAADVTAGLGKIVKIAAEIAVAVPSDKARAKDLVSSIEPVWSTIEGTVKANDDDAYITFEDTFALLKTAATDGDTAKAAQGAADTAKAVAAYLVKYPG